MACPPRDRNTGSNKPAASNSPSFYATGRRPQHFLYFFPLPHEHGSFRPSPKLTSQCPSSPTGTFLTTSEFSPATSRTTLRHPTAFELVTDPMPPKIPKLGREGAESLALHAVAVIVADDELLNQFMSHTGSGADELRSRITDPDFLGAVLNFVLESDITVEKVAQAPGVAMETILIARSQLPGMQVDWTP